MVRWKPQVTRTDAARQLIRHAFQNGYPVDEKAFVFLLVIDFCPKIAELTIDSNVEVFDSRVPKLFLPPTNFGNIAYHQYVTSSQSLLRGGDV